MYGKVYESIGKKSPQPRRLCKVSSWTVPPGLKKIPCLGHVSSAFEQRTAASHDGGYSFLGVAGTCGGMDRK